MRTIIDSSPLSGPAWVQVKSGERIQIWPRQTIVWVSVTPPTFIALPTEWPRFPAVVDSGFNSTFLISELQLRAWAGIDLQRLPTPPDDRTGHPTIRGRAVRMFEGAVWIHTNVSGTIDLDSRHEPFVLYATPGVIVSPPGKAFARLPLIGMKILEDNGLQLAFDPQLKDSVGTCEIRMSIRSILANESPAEAP